MVLPTVVYIYIEPPNMDPKKKRTTGAPL